MEAIEFVNKYHTLVDNIAKVVDQRFLPAIEALREIDPHDLVKPESYFVGYGAEGYVWHIFRMNCLTKGLK